jgi:hypothetical protein
MLVGTSGSGKSTLATGLFERLAEGEYTFCIVDPEGDYHGLEGAVTLGTSDRPPGVEEVIQLLRKPDGSCVVDLVAMALESRPGFALGLIGRLLELRGATGRPHWIVLDEAHHLMPAERSPGASVPPTSLQNALMITVHPRLVAPTMLSGVAVLIVVGQEPGAKVLEFAQALGTPPPELADVPEALESGEAVVWFRDPPGPPVRIRAAPSRQQRRRHARKYAEGELPEDRSFYFRGPEQKLNLRVQNLILFMQIAEGVDEETWMHHLRAGDYSTWIEQAIKDSDLAKVVREVEETEDSPKTSRQRVREAIEERYTLPAKEGSGTE